MRLRIAIGVAAVAFLFACNGTKAPVAPTVTTTAVQVAVEGNGSRTLYPGETRQLIATATRSDGTALTVTSQATWQSSNPTAATVSTAGLLTAAAEGAVDVSATYQGSKGTLHVDVNPTCTVSLSPASASYSAFGGSTTVTVSVNSPSCGWTTRSDAAWFPFSMQPGTPGSGSFTYAVPPNSTVSARAANIIVETSTGMTATHAITEDRPAGCSYVTQPQEMTFTAAGGTGQFTVIATPNDCHWNVLNGMSMLGVSVTSGFSGTGDGVVRYAVQAHARTIDVDGYIEIAGLSGLNPNGRHHIVVLKR
jgi:Big-like domain-containing protein